MLALRMHMQPRMRLDPRQFPAFAVDLDGVVTQTAGIHAAAWKRLFDDLQLPFDIDTDYRTYVDGKLRRDGLRSFLAARGVSRPEGAADDTPEIETIHGLAARKNRYVLDMLARERVPVHPDAIRLLHSARSRGVRLAVVTASENCAAVLASARLSELFDARVDGVEVARLGLRGKPAPDSFVEAARRLGTSPEHTAVFEDAVAGVQAAKTGGFGLVVGVDRAGQTEALRRARADVVVTSLDEIELRDEDANPEARR